MQLRFWPSLMTRWQCCFHSWPCFGDDRRPTPLSSLAARCASGRVRRERLPVLTPGKAALSPAAAAAPARRASACGVSCVFWGCARARSRRHALPHAGVAARRAVPRPACCAPPAAAIRRACGRSCRSCRCDLGALRAGLQSATVRRHARAGTPGRPQPAQLRPCTPPGGAARRDRRRCVTCLTHASPAFVARVCVARAAARRRTGRNGGRLVRTGGPPESPASGGARYKPPLRGAWGAAVPLASVLPWNVCAGSSHAPLRVLRRSARHADTGIALEKDMAIELRDDAASGVNEDGSTWCVVVARRRCRALPQQNLTARCWRSLNAHARWRKSGEDVGEGGYRCRWTVMGGAARDGGWEYNETVRAKRPTPRLLRRSAFPPDRATATQRTPSARSPASARHAVARARLPAHRAAAPARQPHAARAARTRPVALTLAHPKCRHTTCVLTLSSFFLSPSLFVCAVVGEG
jgi:hypothetical protein